MFSMQIRPEVLKRLREEYPVGCTVELIETVLRRLRRALRREGLAFQ